jgi:catechol-2,3-dioxygenase
MAVKRIVANIAVGAVGPARAFYHDVLGMNVVMDQGWILTFAAEGDNRGWIRNSGARSLD